MKYYPSAKQDRGLHVKWTVQVTDELDDKVKRWASDRGMSPSEAIRTLVRMALAETEPDGDRYVRVS